MRALGHGPASDQGWVCGFEIVVAQPVAHAALGEALGRALHSAPQLDGDLPPLEVEALQPRLHLAAEVGSGVGLGLGLGLG